MSTLVDYQLADGVATLRMDDGKVNVMSLAMQSAVNEAFDRATADKAVVVLAGRDGVFSAGFDLVTLRGGGPDALQMLRGGFELALRVLSHPYPVVTAATGHAIAMGCFLLTSGDYRIGANGAYRFTANEVAIGLTLPYSAITILRSRLTPAALHRAAALAEVFTPENAVEAGMLDRVVEPESVVAEAQQLAKAMTQLNLAAHTATKLRARQSTLDDLRAGIESDYANLGA
jgi:enoyl-CoA hydratase